MAKPFDYSKWDNIELSDDESDLHPNIDKESWFRLKHRTRLEREEKEDVEVREIQAKNVEDEAQIKLIEARLKNAAAGEGEDAEFVDTEALEIELQELVSAVNNRNLRVADINERRKWTIDNICKVKDEKTIVNKTSSAALTADLKDVDVSSSPTAAVLAKEPSIPAINKAPLTSTSPPKPVPVPVHAAAPTVERGAEPANTIKRERMAVISYNDYCLKNEAVLEKFCEIADLESTKDFLFKHCDILLHEHAQSYILLSCLEDEMNGKHKRMKAVCRQSQILSHIQELGVSMRRDPRDVILPFFKRIEEKDYLSGFLSAVADFTVKIQKRAVEKRKEMDEEKRRRIAEGEEEEDDEDYEVEGNVPLGPGGLNPLEVLKTLPKALKKAFESQDIEQLHQVLAEMPPEEARMHMKRCVDSGLWVSKDPTVFDQEGDDEESEGEAHESEAVDI